MADGVAITPGVGTTIATDLVGGYHFQRIKVTFGDDGVATDASATNPLPVTIPGGITVTGGLTDTQLRASALPVSLAALPALATGANVIGGVTQSGTWSVGVTGTVAVSIASQPLPTGAATSAKQDTLLAAFPASLGAKTAANSFAVVIASDQSTIPVSTAAATSTSRILSATGTTNATSAKASAGTLKAIQGYNNKASPVYLKLYDKASAPTVGTDAPVKTIYLPASSAFALDFSFTFSTGIAYALTGAAADNDTTALTAGDIVCLNIDYI